MNTIKLNIKIVYNTLGKSYRRVQPCNMDIFLLTHFDAMTKIVSVCSIHVFITHNTHNLPTFRLHMMTTTWSIIIFVIRVER